MPCVTSIKINCDFKYLENCIKNCYQCVVQKLIITKPNQTVTQINGEHLYGETSFNVVTLRIIDQIVIYIPSHLGRHHFPYLTNLKIWSSRLSELNQKNLREFRYLTDLSVSGNELQVLSSDIFEHNQRLRHIDFTRNRLKHIGSSILHPLRKLIFADFYEVNRMCSSHERRKQQPVFYFQNDCISDGAKFSFDNLITNLREKCKPTAEMMIEEIDILHRKVDRLRAETESLRNEVERREQKVKVCQEGTQANARLDTLFPGEIDWDEAWRP